MPDLKDRRINITIQVIDNMDNETDFIMNLSRIVNASNLDTVFDLLREVLLTKAVINLINHAIRR